VHRIVITDYEFADLAPEREVLDRSGIELVTGPFDSREALIDACRGADAIINQYVQLDAGFIAALERCVVICRYGIGVNTIDVPAATAAGIMVANVPDGSIDDVSDHAAAMILSLARGLGTYDRAMRSGEWDYAAAKPLHRLRGKTLGLVGFGNIPRRLAEKMRAFGMEIAAYDPFVPDDAVCDAGAVPLALDALMGASDVVSVHVPLNDRTRAMIGREQLALLRPTAFVVNTARGGVIDEAALADALRSGSVRGAGLDVFESEPIGAGSEILSLPGIVLSPHCAWYSEESEHEIRTKTAQNAVSALFGGRPDYLFNTDVHPRVTVR